MKQISIFLTGLFLLCVAPANAQSTSGTDFWLTFGYNQFAYDNPNLQIRIVSGEQPASGTIYFTALGTSHHFNISAHQIHTHVLDNTEVGAAYNTNLGVSNLSIHITSNDNPITVYALNHGYISADATNILPVTALGKDYYQISYTGSSFYDAYAVVAIADNTKVYHDETLVATIHAGEVYYNRTTNFDMTGAHIMADEVVAFFALPPQTLIPPWAGELDCLFQQLPPVNTWGKSFFVPVSHLTTDRVRIVASQDDTYINQTGGELKSSPGSQMRLDSLQAGQFVELEVYLDSAGCYIEANKPVGVCAYLTGHTYNGFGVSDPAQGWIAPIEQTVQEATIAPFIPEGNTELNDHRAIVVTPTATKDSTKVSIGGAPPVSLSGGSWVDNATAGMSFYNMPLTNDTAAYHFTNAAGLFVMGYGVGYRESYYYLAAGGMRNLTCAFYANEVFYADLIDTLLDCSVTFRAEVEGLNPNHESLIWYINGVEVASAQDQLQWSHNFSHGEEYEITLWVLYDDNITTATISGTLKTKKLWIKLQNFQR